MRIAIFGSGGVGGYFGGRLAAAGEEVVFLARGAHLAALRREGLTVSSPKGNLRLPSVRATDRPGEIGPVDVVLLTVKLYDLDAAAAELPPMIGPGTLVVTLQNGVEAVDMVSRHVGTGPVVAGVAYIVAAVDSPGSIRHTVADSLVFGERDGSRSARVSAFEAAGRKAGFLARVSETIEVDLWTKFARLSTWSGMTAVTRSPMGVIRESPALLAMMMEAHEEAVAVARARGIHFGPAMEAETLAMVHGFPFESKSSMLEDLERGRMLELPWLSGAVERFGREAGVPTPIHRFLATVLEPFARGHGR